MGGILDTDPRPRISSFRDERSSLIILGLGFGALLAGAVVFVWWWVFAGPFYPLAKEVKRADGAYSLAAPLPVALTESSGAFCRGKFYLVGGIGPRAQTLNALFAYEPERDRWIEPARLPYKVSHAGVTCADGHLYIVGGFGPLGIRLRGFMFAQWNPLPTMLVFDPATGTLSEGPPLPEARGAGGFATTAGALWYAGGIDAERKLSAALFRFDLAARAWTRMADMPTARDHLRMEAVGGKLYAISGRRDDLRFNLDVVEGYDIATDTWSARAPIPVPRGGFGSTVHHGRIYTFGGEHVWKCYDRAERYDPETDAWETLSPMPEPRHGICAAALGDAIHLVSGGPRPRISVSRIHRVYRPSMPGRLP